MQTKDVVNAILSRIEFLMYVDAKGCMSILENELFINSTQLYELENRRIELIKTIENNAITQAI
jgi:hypothetical protein